jgi:hypothetical protein
MPVGDVPWNDKARYVKPLDTAHWLHIHKETIMTIGPATLMAIIAAALATLLWWIGKRLALAEWLCMLLFGIGLAVVILAGPLIKLP